MIVDDEQPLVELAEEMVARLGYEPVGFVSSSAALRAFRDEPHALRCDTDRRNDARPRRNGIRAARSARMRPSIPILLMSGRADAPLAERAQDMGIDEVLRKPLHGREHRGIVGARSRSRQIEVMSTHILVVDDDPQIRSLLVDYLGVNEMRVSTASNGGEMMQILSDETIDLVILDLRLAGEDGMAIARSLRERMAVPVIMLTGVRDEADRVMGLELGADDYVMKPFSPRELLARIRTVLRRAKNTAPDGAQRREVRAYRFGEFELNLRTRRLRRQDGQAISLTNGEVNFLAALLAAPERILTRDQLLEASRMYDNEVYDRAIDIQSAAAAPQDRGRPRAAPLHRDRARRRLHLQRAGRSSILSGR